MMAGAGAPEPTAQRSLRPDLPLPNPYLAWLPSGVTPDWKAWNTKMAAEAAARSRRLGALAGPIFGEQEANGVSGENDLPPFAESLPEAGTAPGESARFEIHGTLLAAPAEQAPASEPNGAIPLAPLLDVGAGAARAVRGEIGDGAFGATSGDFDVYRLQGVAGQLLELAVDTDRPLADLDPIVALWSAAGEVIDLNDNLPGSGFLQSFDSYLAVTLPADGTYYAVVGGRGDAGGSSDLEDQFPSDPFDAASGPGAGSTGRYTLTAGLDAPGPGSGRRVDKDTFRLDLRSGDVIGANLLGGALGLTLTDPSGLPRVTSVGRDLSAIYPADSPLPGGGQAALAYVVDRAGPWTLTVARAPSFQRGAYRVEVELARGPLLATATPQTAVLFVDFDGAVIDPVIFRLQPGPRPFSPLADFLPRWGLSPADEDALIDRVLAVVAENLRDDLRSRGGNGDFSTEGLFGRFDLELRNSRDHTDPWGQPGVSRVVVGGTVDELGGLTIGLAQSIDPGNFAPRETAVVLLDFLSAEADDPNSLNGIERAPGVSAVELIGTALGNLVAHEAGHFLANFHTERDSGPTTLMDRGGRIPLLLGVGEDGIFGSADDLDVDFDRDHYSPVEAFSGIENTLDAIAFALVAGGPRAELVLRPRSVDFGAQPVTNESRRSVAYKNAGTAPLALAPPALTGTGFELESFDLAEASLPAGGIATAEVAFTPPGLGAFLGTLTTTSGDPLAPKPRVSLLGQGGVPAATVDPLAEDFGELIYGDSAIESLRSFRITNGGEGALEIGPPVFDGPDGDRFEAVGRAELSLPAGGAGEITLAFRPRGRVGTQRAFAFLPTNDPKRPRFGLELTGTAQGPDIAVTPGPVYFFGSVRVDRFRERIFTIANEGSRDLALAGATIEGPEAGDFTISGGTLPPILPAGDAAQITLRFRPSETGERGAFLVLPNDDPDEGGLEIELLGIGTLPELTVEPAERDFGPVGAGAEAVRFVRVQNTGDATLSVETSSIFGPDADRFRIETGAAPFVLTPDGERVLRLSYIPLAPGGSGAELVFESDDPARATATVPLSGLGTAPALFLDKRCAAAASGEAGRFLCTLEVIGGGPGANAAVEVVDFLPAGVTWLGDDCGAGPPVGDPAGSELLWQVGQLEDGEARTCELDLRIEPSGDAGQATPINRAAARSFLTAPGSFDAEAEAPLGEIAPVEIPTLGTWAWVLLGLLLAWIGWRQTGGRAPGRS